MRRWVWFGLVPALLLPACGDDAGSGNDNELNNNQAGLLCGNGTLEGAEECDDGLANSDTEPDACRTNCQLAHCGDGIVDDGEPCDDGVANSDIVPDACREDCGLPACGDLVVDVQQGESCDDGNTLGGDGCNEQCIPEYCGNGYLEEGEVCDDGNFEVGDGCAANCQSDETCGNGVVDFAVGETCDDGNAGSHDGCASSCTAEIPVWWQWWHGWGTRREHAAAFYTTRNLLVLFGGLLHGGLARDTWAFDNQRWWRIQPLDSPPARRGHSMIYDSHRDRIVLFGGEGNQGALADTWELDGWTWTEVTPASSPPPRLAHGMTYDAHRRRVVIYGGVDANGGTRLADTWEFDGVAWTQRSTAVCPPALDGLSLVYDPTRRVTVLFGGESDAGLSDETWELQAGGWVARTGLAVSPPPRRTAGASFGFADILSASPDVGAMIHGGLGANSVVHHDLWVFDGTNWIDHTSPIRPGTRYGHTLTYCPPYGHIALVGGEDGLSGQDPGDGNYVAGEADTWIYSVIGWNERTLTFLPVKRDEAALAWDPDRRRMVLYGGYTGGWIAPLLDDTWEFDGLQWFQVWTPATAGYRAAAAMAYHEARREMVIFGGRDTASTHLRTTATYDGTTWTELLVAADPTPRHGHAMAYDPLSEVIVLFGGEATALANDTWEWDGAWTQITTAHAPPPRSGHRMVWDSDRETIVLFGGTTGPSAYAGDTWEYDGTGWVELALAQVPDGRHRHGMAYHARRKRVVVFGGAHVTYEQDTWEHDPAGNLWWAIGTAETPSARRDMVMAYNPELQGVMLFGGDSGAWWDPLLNDTWFYGYDSTLPEEQCDNGVDDDTDQRVDCDDPDCDGRPCGTAGQMCAAGVCACAGGGSSETDCADGVDDDCDGLTDCGDPDCAGDPRCEPTEQTCHDAFDNDGDGLRDCGDPDCQASPACAQTLCTDWLGLYCNTVEFGTTLGGAANIDSYGCVAQSLLGPEGTFRFVAPWDGSYTVTLTTVGDVLRLAVIGSGADGTCDPAGACIDVSPIVGDAEVTFNGVAGQVYWFVADATAAGVQAPFAIYVDCPTP